jgi:outer membrane protein TolC
MKFRTGTYNNFRAIGILVILVGSFSYSNAQVVFHSIDELFAYADDNAIILKSASENEHLFLSKVKEKKSDLLPYISASLGYNDNITLQPNLIPAQIFNPSAPEGEFSEVVFGTKYQYNGSLQAKWDVLNFQRKFAVEVSKIELSKAEATTEINRFNLYNQLASTYYSILLTQESIEVYEENVTVSDTILVNALNQFQKGTISESAYNQALINSKQTASQLNMSQNSLQQYYVQLQSQLHTQDTIKIEDNFEQFGLLSSTNLKAHPQLLLQKANLLSSEAQLKQTKAIRLPTLSLVYQNSRTWATDDFLGFSNANELPQEIFGVNLSMNLFDFSAEKKIEQSKINIQLQKLELESFELEMQKEDELLELQLSQGLTQLSDNEQILALQKKNDQHSENLYQSGLISLENRLDKYKELLNAQNNYLNSLASLTLSKYKKHIRQIDFNSK